MTKRESKLLSQWPEYRKRGKVTFVLLRCVLPVPLGVVVGVALYAAISPRHVVYWGGAAFMLVFAGVAGSVRAALLWDRMESLYAAGQHQCS